MFLTPEAENILPLMRRTVPGADHTRGQRRNFRGIVAIAEKVPGEDGHLNWWSHTLVRSGPVAFTLSTVGDPQGWLGHRTSDNFMRQRTVNVCFFRFTRPISQDRPTASKDGVRRAYLILLHGRSSNKSLPGFATIRFPQPILRWLFSRGHRSLQRVPRGCRTPNREWVPRR